MVSFINREFELEKLTQIIEGENASFINLYGRRRIGKTKLLKEFTSRIEKQVSSIYHVFNYETNEIQIEKFFQNILSKALVSIPEYVRKPSWEDIFQILFSSEKPLVVILDEFPFLVDVEPAIPSILQHLWDQYKSTTKLNLILCGSLVSVMQDLMGAKQPLYGRFTHSFNLQPLTFSNSRLFFKNHNLSFDDEIILYGLFGGIPFYLEAISQQSFSTVEEALINGPFSEFSVFREEIPIELRTFTRSYTPYFTIMTAIARGNTKFSEISNFFGKSTDLTRFLDTLQNLTIIEKRESFWTKKKRDNRYYIRDPFYRFWFRYIQPYSMELNLLSPDSFYSSIVGPTLDNFFGLSFEIFCAEYISEMSKRGLLKDKIMRIDNFTGKFTDPISKDSRELEIDLIASGSQKDIMIVGECKWWTKDISTKEIHKFVDNSNKFKITIEDKIKSYKKIELWFFTRKNVKLSLKSSFPDIKFISLDDMKEFYS